MLNKRRLVGQYREILERGCLSKADQERVLAGLDVPGVITQQSGGSSGAPPLRIPRTTQEMLWLGGHLIQHHAKVHGKPPERAAFLGGISHLEAGQRVEREGPPELRNFSGSEFTELDRFDPDLLSMYPSFAREIADDRSLELRSLRSIKLGGEPILSTDLAKLFVRFPSLVVIEQLGSTEMPALAFRRYAPGYDSGYVLTTERYEFRFADTPDWQPLVVRDTFPNRAFPIDDWFQMDDEVQVRAGQLVALRRADDPAYRYIPSLDTMLAGGCTQVQLLTREEVLLYQAPAGRGLPDVVRIEGQRFSTRRERCYRLLDSNKLPLVLDTATIPSERMYR